jgi:hypothetical protein
MFGEPLAELPFLGSYVNAPPLKGPIGTMAPGSRNFLTGGESELIPFKGLPVVPGLGSRVLFPVLNGYGGLGDFGGNGAGSLFSHIARTLGYIGNGQVSLNGVNIPGATASSTLKILLSRAGSYTAVDSGPYSAGLSQPSAPIVATLDAPGVGFSGLLEGAVSFKIARLRSSTGARSIASLTSAVLLTTKQTVRLTFPAASAGQDFWVLFAPQAGGGGVLPHYRLAINGALQISEATVAAGVVDGVARSIEIEYQTGDLTPETAWVDDYPPPAGTHAFALENVWAVGGCYSDATTGPSSASPGTAIAVSLKNAPESYKPTHLLYLPEQILSILSRPSDSHVYIGCRQSVHAVMYTGAEDGPALSIITIWPDVGIGNPHGWCQVNGVLYAFVAKAGAVTIGPLGRPDNSFAKPVRAEMKGWAPEDTIVGHDADSQSVVWANGRRAYALNLQDGTWSATIPLSDFQNGTALSCVTTQNSLKLCLADGPTHTLYTWNGGNGGSNCAAFSQWTGAPAKGLPKTLRAYLEAVQSDNTNFYWVSIHRNLRKVAVEDAVIAAGTNVLESDTAKFTAGDVGKYVLVYGAGVAGAPLLARIGTFTNPTTVSLVSAIGSFSGAAVQNATTTVNGAYCVIGAYIFARTPRAGSQEVKAKRWLVRDTRSFAVGISMQAQNDGGQPLGVCVYGSTNDVWGHAASR